MDHIETIIIGAGVVGLAIARKLAQDGHEVLVLEGEDVIGSITSSRNSGVIHAGIYYKPGSLKARLCVEGRHKLYAYAKERDLPHRKCGKLVVATDKTQIPALRQLLQTAQINGVEGIREIRSTEAQQMESEVFCVAALHVPVTGIIDVHPYMLALQGDAEEAGAVLALRTRVKSGTTTDGGFVLDTMGDTSSQIACKNLINAAGLGAQSFSRSLKGLDPTTIPPQILAKGNYFSLTGKQPFSMLIYPMPVLGSSGLHAFCDIAGRVRFGPDVEWIDPIDDYTQINYTVDPARLPQFEEAVRRYWPGLPSGVLQPDYSGVRPKITRTSPHDSDFIIQDARTHKIANLIQLYGIESPGLTSSLAIGDYVATLLGKNYV